MSNDEMIILAGKVKVKDGGFWPLNPVTGMPICDRCDNDATHIVYSGPYDDDQNARFFCDDCNEYDDCDVSEPIVRRNGDKNSPNIIQED